MVGQVIRRVKIPVHSTHLKVPVMLAFDDTPGDADTIHTDRAANSSLIRTYKERYFPDQANGVVSGEVRPRTFPNVILLVASWDSITPDAHNEPHHFTSALGISMYKLASSGLVDHLRTNVVVVVTKSMSFWSEFDDFDDITEKNTHWNIEAGRRKGIITDIQRKVFPKMAPWRTVFVENGSSRDLHSKYPILPNGELSHQNLFEAIRSVIETPGPHGTLNLAELHALHKLTGAGLLDRTYHAEPEILVEKSSETILVSASQLMLHRFNSDYPLSRTLNR
jgi:hypothetical protein